MEDPDWAYCGHAKHNEKLFASYEVCEAKEAGYPSKGFTCERHEGQGIADSDFHLYVTALESEYCQSAVAYAMYCSLDLESNRPLAASVNLCPSSLSMDPASSQQQVEVVIHELLHSLVFTESLFEKFIDDDGVVIPLEKVLETSVKEGRIVKKIISPKVAEKTQEHFSCASITGAELEDEGGAGTAGNHWETRLFNGEIMDGMAGQNFHSDRHALSPITLALLEDSGWYTVNWNHAGDLRWGQDAGCVFAEEDCKVYAEQTPDQRWFCDLEGEAQCTAERKGFGQCKSGLLLNSCNIVHTYSNGDCKTEYPAATEGLDWGSVHGLASFCFQTHDVFVQEFVDRGKVFEAKMVPQKGECYKTECNGDGSYTVEVLGTKMTCNSAGEVLNFADYLEHFHSGGIECADPEVLCANDQCPDNCSGNGWCSDEQCVCHLGFGGAKCDQRVCTTASDYCDCEVVQGESSGYCKPGSEDFRKVSMISKAPREASETGQQSHALVEDQATSLKEHWIILMLMAVGCICINGLLVVCIVWYCTRKMHDKNNNRNEALCGQLIDSSKASPSGRISIVYSSIISQNTTVSIEIN